MAHLVQFLAVCFVSLTALDPVTAALPAGLTLGVAVLTTDALANGYADYGVDRSGGVTPGRIGQAVITALAVTLLPAVPKLRPRLRGRRLTDR